MNPRNTAILALVVAALGAFVWFYEIQGGAERAKQEEAGKRLFPGVAAEQIQSIELRTTDGVNARLERAGTEGWKLVAPLVTPADRFAADGVASTLAELAPEATFDTPEPLENYGLAGEPTVRFHAGDQDHVLRLGNATPVGGNVYATDAEGKRVFTLASWRKNALQKTVKQLRDGRVLDFDRAQVKGIALQSADGHVVLERGEGGWRIAAPVEAKADADAVEGLLSDLQYLRADEFVDAPADDAKLGLASPWLAVELTPESGEPIRLGVGGKHEDRRVVRGTAGRVFEIAHARLEALPRALAAYRWKQLASFASEDAVHFELRFQEPGGEPTTILGTSGEGGWTTTPEAMEPGRASRLISELSALRAEEVAADAMGDAERAGLGLAPPRTTLKVLAKPAQKDAAAAVLAELWLGAAQPDGRIPAQRAGEPTVYWLGANMRDQLPISLADWRASFAAKEAPQAETPAAESSPPAPAEPAPEAGGETE
jgi:hypothetical protein